MEHERSVLVHFFQLEVYTAKAHANRNEDSSVFERSFYFGHDRRVPGVHESYWQAEFHIKKRPGSLSRATRTFESLFLLRILFLTPRFESPRYFTLGMRIWRAPRLAGPGFG